MNQDIINKIITEKIPCFFISPHFDDAALSAGGLIAHLARQTRVSVVNVFTLPGQRHTLSAKAFLTQCGYGSARELFNAREKEDRDAFALINIQPRNFGFIEAMWREIPRMNSLRRMISRIIPEFGKVYPVYRFHIDSKEVSQNERRLVATLAKKLSLLAEGEYFLFCPLAVETHVDHSFVREACLASEKPVIFWSDFPYNVRKRISEKKVVEIAEEGFSWDGDTSEKKKIIESYRSQVPALFPGGKVKAVPEIYYFPKTKGEKK